jgi:16S rRNA (guanine527-N7)-methyltransferase
LGDAWSRTEEARRLQRCLDVLAVPSPGHAIDQLLDLTELLALWAARISLTAHRHPSAILERLVFDALAVACLLPESAAVADVGSGAGFPGLPLAILRPQLTMTLIESRERKHHFQREAVRRLALPNVRTLLGRSSEIEPEPQGGVVAQAVGPAEEVVRLLLPWAAPGAWIAIPQSDRAAPIAAPDGIARAEIRRYEVPLTGVPRSLWLGRTPAAGS